MNKYFEYNDDTANSHKFWQISQKSKNVTVSYGRIGIANPHQIVKEFDNKDLALAFAEKDRRKTEKRLSASINTNMSYILFFATIFIILFNSKSY